MLNSTLEDELIERDQVPDLKNMQINGIQNENKEKEETKADFPQEQEEDPEESQVPKEFEKDATIKTYAFVNFIYAFLVILFCISCLLILLYIRYYSKYELDTLKTMQQNWNLDMFQDVKAVPQNTNEQINGVFATENKCPSTHPDVMTIYNWPGSKEGCNCKKGGYDPHKCCFGGLCMQDTCPGTDVKSIEKRDLTIWSIGNQNYIMCGKRVANTNLLNLNDLMTSEGKCKDEKNYQLCQTQDKNDTFNFCVPKGAKCPIRNLKISDEKPSNSNVISSENNNDSYYKLSTGETFEENVPLQNGFYLYISRQQNNAFPVSQTQISEGKGLCLNDKYRDLQGRKDYLLLNQRRLVEECKIDSRWKLLSKMVELSFFQVNNNFDQTVKPLPDYDVSDYYQYSLFFKNYNSLSLQCRVYLNKNEEFSFRNYENNLNDIINSSFNCFYSIGFLSIYFIVIEVFFSIDHRPKRHYGLVFYNKLEKNKLISLAKFFALLLKCSLFITYVVQIFMLNSIASDLRNASSLYIKQKCFLDDRVAYDYFDYVGSVLLRGQLFAILLAGWIPFIIFEANLTYFLKRKLLRKSITDESEYGQSRINSMIVASEQFQINKQSQQSIDGQNSVINIHKSTDDVKIAYYHDTGSATRDSKTPHQYQMSDRSVSYNVQSNSNNNNSNNNQQNIKKNE